MRECVCVRDKMAASTNVGFELKVLMDCTGRVNLLLFGRNRLLLGLDQHLRKTRRIRP